MKEIDFNLISDAYHSGWGSMGVPSKGFYVLTKDSIQSLQEYLTRLTTGSLANNKNNKVVCVFPENENIGSEKLSNELLYVKLHDTATRTYGASLVNNLTPLKVGEALLGEIYGGEYDTEAFIDGMAHDGLYDSAVMNGFMRGVLDYYAGTRTVMSTAAYQSFQRNLLPELDKAPRTPDTNELMPEGLPKTLSGYVRRLVESQPDFVPGCAVMSSQIAGNVRRDIESCRGACHQADRDKFHRIVANLDKGVFREAPETKQELTSREFEAYSESLYAPAGQEPSHYEVYTGQTKYRRRPQAIDAKGSSTYLQDIRQRVLSPYTHYKKELGLMDEQANYDMEL